jgi:hypothetical protein
MSESPVLDHTQDLSGAEQHRLTSLYPPPAFVKAAAHDRLCGDPEKTAAHSYADQANRQFPCHTAPATWMSALFFFDKQAQLQSARAEVIEKRIKVAAHYFNIGQIIEDLQTKIAADAQADDDFALVWVSDDSKERHYPLRNPAEIKTAAAWFTQFRDEFHFHDRNRIAEKILEKAAAHQVPLDESEMLACTAGRGYCAGSTIAGMLEKRGDLVARTHGEHAREVRALAHIVRQNHTDVRDHAFRMKMAAVVDMFDRDTKLNRMYDDGGLERPEEVLFQVTEKAASDFLNAHVQMTSGTIYEKTAFEALDREVVSRWMGTELADEVCNGTQVDPTKLAVIAATLPRPDAEMFDRMASEAGVNVFARDKAAMDSGLTRSDLLDLANQYEHEPALAGLHPERPRQ